MALFGFGKKKEQAEPAAPGSPMEQVMAMQQRGMDNNQISTELQRQGYNSSQIYEALNQMNISGPGMEQPPQQPQQNYSLDQPIPVQPQEQQPEATPSKDQIEEIAEAIIDEKWKEFEDDVRKIIEWKERSEVRINNLDQQIKDVAASLSTLHKNILNKITDYDKNISDVGVEIKAMEKVFQKVLPSLTENVNKLERLSKKPKKK